MGIPKQVSLTCETCGALLMNRGPVQRYCPECSAAKDRERKAAWARSHPPTPEQSKGARRVRDVKLAGRVAAIEDARSRSINWLEEIEPPDIVRVARIRIPFDKFLSKNSVYSTGNGGHVVIRKRARELREAIAWSFKAEGVDRWPQRKTFIDILVQKPHHKLDAINLVDSICDAVKKGIGVDDRWFAITRLDWEIVKRDPCVFIGVGQDGTTDQMACSYCGRVLELTSFGRGSHFKGRVRVCLGCSGGKAVE